MLPSIKQWKNWSLPSKYTAIGLVIGVISLALGVTQLTPDTREEFTTLSGKYVMTSLGEHEINYGANFVTAPRLEILDGYDNPDSFEIVSQRPDGFTIKLGGALSVGTLLVWEATGQLKNANK